MCTKKEHENPESNHGKNDTPPGQGRLNDIQTGHHGNETGEESHEVPARWALVIVIPDHDFVMGVYFRIVQQRLFFLIGSFAGVSPDEISGRCEKPLKISEGKVIFDASQCEEAPSGLDLGVVPEEHMNKVPSETSVSCDKAENVT